MNTYQIRNRIPFSYRIQFNSLWLLEFFLGIGELKEWFRKRKESVNKKIVAHLKTLPKGQRWTPQVFENLDPETFLKEVLPKGRPVILRGLAKNWPCCKKWTPDYFSERFRNYPLIVTNVHSDRGGDIFEISMEKYVETIKTSSNHYARFSKLMHDHPELKDDFDMKELMSYKHKTDFWVATQFFMGPPSTFTHIHCAFINNLFVQAHGRKKWLIFTPHYNPVFMPPVDRAPTFRSDQQYERVPADPSVFDHMDYYDFIVEPGDVLYNPPFHWHYVTNHTMSISLSFRILSVFSALKASPILGTLTAFATNPPALQGLYGTWKAKNFLNFYDPKRKEAAKVTG